MSTDQNKLKYSVNGLGENLRLAMHAKGLTQGKLAKLTGVNQSFLSGIFSGKKYPSIHVLVVLMNILDVSFDELTIKRRV